MYKKGKIIFLTFYKSRTMLCMYRFRTGVIEMDFALHCTGINMSLVQIVQKR